MYRRRPRRPALIVLAALTAGGLVIAWALHKLGHPAMVCALFASGAVWGVVVMLAGPRLPR